MTMLVAWVGVDSRVPSSAYIATDSRISYDQSRSWWDCGPKTFASTWTPDLFGFVGTVEFPVLFLTQFVQALNAGILGSSDAVLRVRQGWLQRKLRDALQSYPTKLLADFSIVHVGRAGFGRGSVFEIQVHQWRAGALCSLEPEAPTTASTVMKLGSAAVRADPDRWVDGSGRALFERHLGRWQASSHGGTSRAVFSAFCDALRSGEVHTVGGPPQLVGLRKNGGGFPLAVRYGHSTFAGGLSVAADAHASRLGGCFNEVFDRVDLTGARLFGPATLNQPFGHGRL